MDRASPSTALNNGMISNVDVNVVLLRCFRSLFFFFIRLSFASYCVFGVVFVVEKVSF